MCRKWPSLDENGKKYGTVKEQMPGLLAEDQVPQKRSMSIEEGGGWSGPSRARSAYASCLPPRSLEAGHSKDES